MNNLESKNSVLNSAWGRIVAIIVLGSLCGFIEVILGGLLRRAGFPVTSGLLTGLGFGVIAFGLVLYGKPMMAIWLGLIAVLIKQLAAPILGVSVMCKMNSCVAVMMEYGALAAITGIALKKMQNNSGWRWLAGGFAAFVSSIAFYFIGMHVTPCNYLMSFNSYSGFFSYLGKESLSWTAFSAALFPLGWLVAEKSRARIEEMIQSRRRYIYVGATAIAAFCWALCAFAVSYGF